MITFLRIHIVGFCSFSGDTTIDLNPKQTILIKAPNGSGKSTIFSALSWGLYGKTLKGSSQVNTWDKLRPKEYKGTMVEIFLQIKSSVYKVIRCQNYKEVIDDGAKGGDRLMIIKDADPINIKGKVKIQEYLNSELNMSFKLFTNSIMFGEDVQRLISESNSDKKKLFEEVFNLGFINYAKELASDEKSDLQVKYRDINTQMDKLKSSYESNKESYEDLRENERNFNKSLKKKMDKLKKLRTKLTKDLIEAKKYYSEDKEQIVDIKIKRQKKSLDGVKTKLAEAQHLSKVPLLDVINSVIKLLEKGESDKALKKVKSIKKAFKDIDKLSGVKEYIMDNLESLNDRRRELSSAKNKCDRISDDIAEVDEDIINLKKEKPKKLSSKYKAKMKEDLSKYKSLEPKMVSYKKRIENYEWLLEDPLSNKGIKAFLFDSCLEQLNNTLQGYSEVLGFKIQFEIDLNSTKKDFVTLIERGSNIIEYDELSRGEKQLCDVAMAFAMNESLTSSRGVNIALLDEVFEHLDEGNIELVIGLINKVYEDKALFLITHQASLPLSNVKTLQVSKSQGQSTVKIL